MTLSSSPAMSVVARKPDTAWRTALPALALVLVALLVLYRNTGADMVAIWIRSDTFSHAFLVPPIVAWLIWRQRAHLGAIAPRANAWMLLPVAAAAFFWLLGELAAVNAVTQLAFVALLVLAVPAVLGLRIARAAAFPLAFLFFAVPIGEFLLPSLMRMTADFTVMALRLSGVPVFNDGLLFMIPSGNWSVVEACSGVRYLIASFMVGTLYAHLVYRSTRRRLIFMAVALSMPVLANWVRAYLIVMLGHLSNNRIATGVDHLIYGWMFFAIVVFLLYQLGSRWAEPRLASDAASASASARPVAQAPAGLPWATALVAACVVLLAAAPLSAHHEIVKNESALTPLLVAPSTLAAGWHADPKASLDWHPKLANPSSEIDAFYTNDANPPVGLYMAYYRGQDEARKLADSNAQSARNVDRRWVRVMEGRRSVAADSGAIDVRTATWRNRGEMEGAAGPGISVWQLYWAGDRFTDSAALAKAHVAADRLLGRGDDAAAIILYARAQAPGEADRALEAFLRANLGQVETQLRRVRSVR